MAIEKVGSFCQRLIQAAGTSGKEGSTAKVLKTEFDQLGFQHVERDRWGNLIGRVGPDTRPRLLFAAHMDTVPADPETWTVPPFKALEKDGRIYGRGASDMKGALAAMVYAAATVGKELLRGSIWVTGTVCEEIFEGAGLGKVIDAFQPDYVIIGESSDFAINRGQRGRAEVCLETIGIPSHSAHPESGRNALIDMVRLLQEIERITLPRSDFLGPAILEPTDIISDPYPGLSVLPSRCRVTFDRRVLVGESEEDVLAPIQETIDRVQYQRPGLEASVKIAEETIQTYTGVSLTHKKFAPGWEIAAEHSLVQQACHAVESSRLPVRIGHYDFCTDGSYSAGVAGIPTIGLGPSKETQAHVIDEYIDVAELFTAVKVYQSLIYTLLS